MAFVTHESSKLKSAHATVILYVFQLQLLVSGGDVSGCSQRTGVDENSLFALCVKIDAANASRNLIETYVVEAFKTRTGYRPYTVIRH
jgi:hypothetical protein